MCVRNDRRCDKELRKRTQTVRDGEPASERESGRRVRTPLLLDAKLIAPIIHGETCLVAAFGREGAEKEARP